MDIKNNILIIDDEASILTALEFALNDKFVVDVIDNAEEGMEILKNRSIDIVLLDLFLGNQNGLDVLEMIRSLYPDIIVIVMTAYGSIESSIEAIHRGAYYYITKPIDINSLIILMDKALDYKNLSTEYNELKKIRDGEISRDEIISTSKSMKMVLETIDRVKDLDVNVLISGESGTGKELIAKRVHNSSKRKNYPLVTVNCAAIPYSLLESELFGYEKGAFTGASQKMKGKFELADRGTIFLDEIGDMDIGIQAKLLRVLETKEVTPLGSEKTIPLNTRILAATNLDLDEEVKNGKFREDLYFRLNVINLKVPSLRDRKEDIPILSQFFLNKYSREFDKEIQGFLPSTVDALESYDYPGNVRELKNIVQRAVALTNNHYLGTEDLPINLLTNVNKSKGKNFIPIYIGESLSEIEKKAIVRTYNSIGNKRETAKVLGISERTLYNKLDEYKID